MTSGDLPLDIAAFRNEIAWGPVIDGFQAGLGFQEDRSKYRVGEKVGFYVYLRNAGRSSASISLRYNGEPLHLDGTTAAGDAADIQSTMLSLLPFPRSITLAPGEHVILSSPELEIASQSKQTGFTTDLMVAKPGRYRLRCERISNYLEDESVPGRGELPTGQLRIDVTRA